jgi:hypothetical protein
MRVYYRKVERTGCRRREEQVKGSRDSEALVNSETWLNEIK